MPQTIGAVALLVTCALVDTTAQRGAPPPRDGASVDVSGTGFIGGTVFEDSTTGAPLRRATVTLRNVDLVNAMTSLSTARISVTDDAGTFAFANLPAGRFSLVVSKPAYLTMGYGAKAPRGQGLTIALAEGQRVPDLVVRLPRGAVITGRVADETGRPAVGVRVGVAEQVTINGESSYRSSFGTGGDTDDRGVYRIFGLNPGTYLVGTGSTPGSFIGGGPRMTTAAEVEWARRGATLTGATPPAPARGAGMKTASVFYPGTTNSASAVPIAVTAGEERNGIDFTVHAEPTASLEGTVTRADGRPARNVQLLPVLVTNSVQVGFPAFPPRATVTPQGQFSVSGLAPGHYLVTARASSGEVLAPPPPGGRGVGAPIADLWATAEIDMTGQDITGLALTLMPGMSVSGRMIFESKGVSPPADLTTARVNMNAPPATAVSLGVPSVAPDADGTFTFPAVAPGSYLVSAYLSAPSTQAWTLKSAVADGRDVLDTPLEVRPGIDTTGVVVTFTDQVTQLTGTLTDRTGRPAPSYFVIAYTTNAAHWRQQSRWLRQPTRPASDGKFVINGLPPGEYYLAALSEFNQQEWYTPEFLQQLVPMSLKFTLAEGEKKVQDLKLAGQ